MTSELFKSLSIEDYHSNTDFLSKSMLSKFADCPARFKHHYIDGFKQEETKSLRLGNAMHTLALEPETWKARYHIMPETYYNDKGERKDWRNDMKMSVVQDQYQLAGWDIVDKKAVKTERSKTIIKKSEYEIIEGMSNSLLKHPLALSLLKADGYVEASIFWENEDGMKFRCRPDFMRNDGLLVDLKTAESVRPENFYKNANNFNYHLSPALTWEGYTAHYGKEPDNYVFLCVESEPPYLISCFEVLTPMDELIGINYLEYGQKKLAALVKQLDSCRTLNIWPEYVSRIEPMKIPSWEASKFMKEAV